MRYISILNLVKFRIISISESCILLWTEKVLPPFQIIGRLTFLILSLTARLSQKFVQKYHFFCCGLLYQYKLFKNDLNLTIFA